MFPHRYQTVAGRKRYNDGQHCGYSHLEAKFALYDLKQDIGETTDVAKEHPEVVDRLSKFAEQVREDLGDRLQNKPGTGRRPIGRLDPTK